MQDALGGKAIHAALRSLTNICSGLLNCGAECVPSGCDVRFEANCVAKVVLPKVSKILRAAGAIFV